MREEGGVTSVSTLFGFEAWLVTRPTDGRQVLSDARRFSNVIPPDRFRRVVNDGTDEMSEQDVAQARAGNLLGLDPPEHTSVRRMLTPSFTVRQMRRLEPRITRIVADHLDAMERSGP